MKNAVQALRVLTLCRVWARRSTRPAALYWAGALIACGSHGDPIHPVTPDSTPPPANLPPLDTVYLPRFSGEWLGSHFSRFTCFANDARLRCWGAADGMKWPVTDVVPTSSTGASVSVSAYAVGYGGICVLDVDGRAWCAASPFRPLEEIRTRYRFVELKVAFATVCGLRPNGRVACWGEGDFGGLGTGRTVSDSITRTTPTLIASDHHFSRIESHSYGWCAIERDSQRAFCWGSSPGGVIFVPSFSGSCTTRYWFLWTETSCHTPTPLPGELAVSRTSGTLSSACVIAASDSRVWCMGVGAMGETGNGRLSDVNVTDTLAPVVGGLRATIIDAGATHYCAIDPGGAVWCWGNNFRGFLGIGNPSCNDGSCGPSASGVPLRLNLLATTTLTTGTLHACARASGGVWCWGYGETGALGLPNEDAYTPRLVIPLGASK